MKGIRQRPAPRSRPLPNSRVTAGTAAVKASAPRAASRACRLTRRASCSVCPGDDRAASTPNIAAIVSLLGTYRSVSSKHVPRYLAEFQYRFNRRYNLAAMLPRLCLSASPRLRCPAERGCRRRGGPEPDVGDWTPRFRPPPDDHRMADWVGAHLALCLSSAPRLVSIRHCPGQQMSLIAIG